MLEQTLVTLSLVIRQFIFVKMRTTTTTKTINFDDHQVVEDAILLTQNGKRNLSSYFFVIYLQKRAVAPLFAQIFLRADF